MKEKVEKEKKSRWCLNVMQSDEAYGSGTRKRIRTSSEWPPAELLCNCIKINLNLRLMLVHSIIKSRVWVII